MNMKKLFTLLTLALISIGSAWGEDLPKPLEIGNTTVGKYTGTIIATPTGTLDLATQETFTADDNGWIVFGSRSGMAGKDWRNGDGTNGGETTWTVPAGTTAPFLGSTSESKLERYTVQLGARIQALRFTGAEKASFLGSRNSDTRKMIVSLYSFNGTTFTQIDTKTISDGSVGEVLFEDLNTSTNYVAYVYGKANGSNSDFYEVALKAPSPLAVKTNPISATYTPGAAATALTVAAKGGTSPYTYQWYSCTAVDKTGATQITGETNATYTPSTSATGYYFCRITDSATPTPATVDTEVATITIEAASAPTISVASSVDAAVDKGTAVTLTATVDGNPAPTIKWYSNTSNSTIGGIEITGETEETYSPSTASTGTLYYYAVATNSVSSVTSNVVSVVVNPSSECILTKVSYSNGFDAFIKQPSGSTHGTIKAYYLSGTSSPTITATEISEDATYTATSSTLTVTAEDGTTNAIFDITVEEVTPYVGNGYELTFDGTETWLKSGNGWSSSNKWVISKPVEESTNRRVSEGKCRMYFFLAAGEKISLYNIADTRKVDVYRNGTKISGDGISLTKNTFVDITGDESNAYMLTVVSAANGDTKLGKIKVESNSASVDVTSAGYATFSSTKNVDFSGVSAIKVYTAKVNDAKTDVTLSEVTSKIVPANATVIIEAAEGTYTGTVVATASPLADNDLQVATSDMDGSAGNIYVLNKKSDIVGFYKLSASGKLKAGKGYLIVDGVTPSREMLNIDIEGLSTGIQNIKVGTEDNVYYNLKGQRVLYPTKGLYIMNGKKVIVK